MKRSTFSAKIKGRWLRWIYVLCYFKINKIRPTEMHDKLCKSCDMFEDKCVWSALYPISNHSHIRQLQFATHAFSQQVLQQAVQISICQWKYNTKEDYNVSITIIYRKIELMNSITLIVCSIQSSLHVQIIIYKIVSTWSLSRAS